MQLVIDERWRTCAESWGVGDLADALAPRAVRCVRVVGTAADASAIGASRLGGMPDLPRAASWPSLGKTPLSLVAQLDLGELEPGWVPDVPEAGRLWLFVDATRDDGLFPHVLLFSDVGVAGLARAKKPKPKWPSRAPLFQSSFVVDNVRDLEDERTWELPDGGTLIGGCSPSWCEPGAIEAALHHLGLGEVVPYRHMSEARISEEIERHRDARPAWARAHASFLERVVRPKLRAWHERSAEIERRAASYRTLLRVSSEPDLGWRWGDAGVLEVLIDANDLVQRRFDRTYLRLCSS